VGLQKGIPGGSFCLVKVGSGYVSVQVRGIHTISSKQWTYVECVESVNAYDNNLRPKENSEENWALVAARLVLTGFNRKATVTYTVRTSIVGPNGLQLQDNCCIDAV
jgi:hypothetical protein